MGITGMDRKYLWNAFKKHLGNIKLNGGGLQFLFVVTLLFQVISEDTLVKIFLKKSSESTQQELSNKYCRV